MIRRPRLVTPALAAAVALVLSACGSTVQNRATTRQVADPNGLTVAAGASGSSTGDSTANTLGLGSSAASGGQSGRGSTVTTRRSGGSGGSGGVTPGVSSKGVTANSIYVGIVYAVNGDAVNKAAGANGITAGDTKADANAVIDDINKSGGIAGRQLVPIFHPFDSTSTQTLDQQWQGACSDFTQDHKVLLALSQGEESWRQCLQDAGAALVDSDLPTADQAEFQRHHYFIEAGYPNVDRIASYLVTALNAQGYFSPWNSATGAAGGGKAKVGILTYNSNAFKHATDTVMIPALTKLGYVPQVAYISEVQTASDYSNTAAAVSSAELKFRQAGVDHVIAFDSNGGLSLFFMNTASAQHYYPRYGGHTGSAFQVLVSTGDVPADQLRGAMGFGWYPLFDLPADQAADNGPYSNAARRQCLAVMKAHRISFSDPNAEAIAMSYCSDLWLVRTAVNSAGPVINAATFVNAVERLGPSFEGAGSLGTNFGPNRHDGMNKAYYWQFVPGCTCMHYVGPLQTVP